VLQSCIGVGPSGGTAVAIMSVIYYDHCQVRIAASATSESPPMASIDGVNKPESNDVIGDADPSSAESTEGSGSSTKP